MLPSRQRRFRTHADTPPLPPKPRSPGAPASRAPGVGRPAAAGPAKFSAAARLQCRGAASRWQCDSTQEAPAPPSPAAAAGNFLRCRLDASLSAAGAPGLRARRPCLLPSCSPQDGRLPGKPASGAARPCRAAAPGARGPSWGHGPRPRPRLGAARARRTRLTGGQTPGLTACSPPGPGDPPEGVQSATEPKVLGPGDP